MEESIFCICGEILGKDRLFYLQGDCIMKEMEKKHEKVDSIVNSNVRKRELKRDRYNVPEELDYTSAASACDCTGLIPRGSLQDLMLDEYHEIYPFGSPEI